MLVPRVTGCVTRLSMNLRYTTSSNVQLRIELHAMPCLIAFNSRFCVPRIPLDFRGFCCFSRFGDNGARKVGKFGSLQRPRNMEGGGRLAPQLGDEEHGVLKEGDSFLRFD